MKKHFYLVVDVETTNDTNDPLVYDFGYAVTDRMGRIYETGSYINRDIFFGMRDLMDSAYYAHKIPTYLAEIEEGKHEVASLYEIREKVKDIFKRYPIKAVFAYNARFDRNALNTTQRYETKSKFRWFFPYGTEIWDIWNFACNTICLQKGYVKFCKEYGFVSAKGNILTNAEAVYAYMNKVPTFKEEHKGLEDVRIEVAILAKCYATHKKAVRKINPACWMVPQPKKERKK